MLTKKLKNIVLSLVAQYFIKMKSKMRTMKMICGEYKIFGLKCNFRLILRNYGIKVNFKKDFKIDFEEFWNYEFENNSEMILKNYVIKVNLKIILK